METAQQSDTDLKGLLIEAYIDYVLTEGHPPHSVYAFCKKLKIEESKFYDYFNSLEQIPASFWEHEFTHVWESAKSDAEFDNFNAREQMLTVLYGFFERLKQNRSFALHSFSDSMNPLKSKAQLSDLKDAFKSWVREVVQKGIDEGEIADRSKLSQNYDELFWIQLLFLVNFWKKDKSSGFEDTDAAIEKSIRLSFDLIEKNALESAFDFGKFLFQSRK